MPQNTNINVNLETKKQVWHATTTPPRMRVFHCAEANDFYLVYKNLRPQIHEIPRLDKLNANRKQQLSIVYRYLR